MPFDSETPTLTPARAEHGFAGRGMAEPTTFVFDGRGERLGWIDGHKPSGFLWNVSHHGAAYRLEVVSPLSTKERSAA
jgi:hypothetical protein